MQQIVYVSLQGHLVGEDHPNAKLNWHDVELMRQLHDEGLSMMAIARKFELPWSTVRDVCRYLTWCEQPVRPIRPARNSGRIGLAIG